MVQSDQVHRCNGISRRNRVVITGLCSGNQRLMVITGKVKSPVSTLVPKLLKHNVCNQVCLLKISRFKGCLVKIQQGSDKEGVIIKIAVEPGCPIFIITQYLPVYCKPLRLQKSSMHSNLSVSFRHGRACPFSHGTETFYVWHSLEYGQPLQAAYETPQQLLLMKYLCGGYSYPQSYRDLLHHSIGRRFGQVLLPKYPLLRMES